MILLDFAREAESFAEAVASAVADVRRVGVTVERVEPDNLVSLSDIAERAGLTRQAVSLYEGFPHPVARVTTATPLWDWLEVVEWLHARGQIRAEVVGEARALRQVNLGIEHEVRQPPEAA